MVLITNSWGWTMGERDSSQTRVAPVFDQLKKSQGTWVDRLLSLPCRALGLPLPPPPGVGNPVETAWHPSEKVLPAPKGLLKKLLEQSAHLRPKPEIDPKWSSATREKRKGVLGGDFGVITEGVHLLLGHRGEKWPAEWWVLEGPTHVDAFIRTDKAVIVIEGKRTETGPTTRTDWMPVRYQMLRNLDCAREAYPNLALYGFYIVEGDERGAVPKKWWEFVAQTTAPESVTASLPHRPEEEQIAIISAFRGITTWQEVCSTYGIDFKKLPDTV